VTLADGTTVTLTPGGQNVLLKAMVETFCPTFTPGGEVLYIGDAGKADPIYDRQGFANLGISLDKHGKLPDLVVHMPDRKWLVLMEAASTHGPVDAERHDELATLFFASTAGLVYVSCFPSRATMRK
jgi:BsuBI/PstI restriction endonuclease domain